MTRLLTTALLIATLFTASTLLSSPATTHAAAGTLYFALNRAGSTEDKMRKPFGGIVTFVGKLKPMPLSRQVFVA